jgi:predicted peroxiredoxin
VEKMVVIIKHADDEPEFCINAMMLAVNACSSGLHPVVILQSKAVSLASKGFASGVKEQDMPPMEGLIETYLKSGGRMLVSAPAIRKRGMTSDDLIDGAMVVSPSAAMREIQDAKHVIAY